MNRRYVIYGTEQRNPWDYRFVVEGFEGRTRVAVGVVDRSRVIACDDESVLLPLSIMGGDVLYNEGDKVKTVGLFSRIFRGYKPVSNRLLNSFKDKFRQLSDQVRAGRGK